MLAEWFRYLTTRCPKHLRERGYLREIIGTESRYGRCRKAWEPHLRETRKAVLAAAATTASHKKVAVLGSGLLYDVPLAELAGTFADVVLIDIFHMPAVRRATAKYKNVRLIAHDLTGGELPESDADLVASVNLLTQLPFIPRRIAGESEDFSRTIMIRHLEQLASVRGTTCLVTEVEHLVCAGDQVIERTDPLYGLELGETDHEWFWDLAPHPELHRQYDTRYRVISRIS